MTDAAKTDGEDVRALVELLSETDDNLRYSAFLKLQAISQKDDSVYPYWDVFVEKLNSGNSYQRSIGLMLLAENVAWDRAGRFAGVCADYLAHCNDEKFITARQCIQGLNKIIAATTEYREEIIAALAGMDFGIRKDTQKGLLLRDAAAVLAKLGQAGADGEPGERK